MRLFIAIDFDNKDYFQDLQKKIGDDNAKIKWVDSFHLTLKFLGEVSEDKVEEIKEKLMSIKFEKFGVETSGLGVFPSESYIRVVWIGFKDSEKIDALQQKIEDVLSDMFGKDKKFSSHITLGRVRFVKDKPGFVEKLKSVKVEELKFEVKEFRLVKSELTKQGPVYEDVGVFDSII